MENFILEFTVIIRVLVALVLGMTIGVERQKRKTESKNHGGAGLRTNSLVCMGTALITAIGVVLFPADPVRLAASIMTGIGFVGAGAIIASEKKHMGLTNAAAIWAAAAIGIAAGIGFYITAVFATLITVIVLELRRFERLE
jgi:putative Mg2+ transporter-C (MgtC) family protein